MHGARRDNRRPSLDSYLAALDYEKSPGAVSIHLRDGGFIGTAWANRFWNSSTPFAHGKFGGYLVTRLDGYTEADAKSLTTRALAAERVAGKSAADGKVLLDTCPAFGYADPKRQPVPYGRLRGNQLQRIQCRYATGRRSPAFAERAGRVDPDGSFRREAHGLLGISRGGATTGTTTPMPTIPCVFRPGHSARRPFPQAPEHSCRPRGANRSSPT